MAVITNFSTLKTAVSNYLDRSDLFNDGYIENFIQAAENKIYRTLLHRGVETTFSGTISSGVLTLPTRYVALKYAYVNDSPICLLSKVPPETIYEKYPVRSGSHVPSMIAREGSNFIFGPYPSAKTINGVYYQSPEKLADGTTTANWYTTNAPEVLLYGSLLEAAPFIKNDPRLPIWAQLFQNAKDSILDNEWKESGTLGSIAIRTA